MCSGEPVRRAISSAKLVPPIRTDVIKALHLEPCLATSDVDHRDLEVIVRQKAKPNRALEDEERIIRCGRKEAVLEDSVQIQLSRSFDVVANMPRHIVGQYRPSHASRVGTRSIRRSQ